MSGYPDAPFLIRKESMSDQMIMYHQVKAPHGTVVLRNNLQELLAQGWVSGPHLFGEKKEVIEKESKTKSDRPDSMGTEDDEPIILYHESQAPIGKTVRRGDSDGLLKSGWVKSPDQFTGDVAINREKDSLFVRGVDEASAHMISPEAAKRKAKKRAEEAKLLGDE